MPPEFEFAERIFSSRSVDIRICARMAATTILDNGANGTVVRDVESNNGQRELDEGFPCTKKDRWVERSVY